MQLPLALDLRPSRSLALILVIAHGAALAVVMPTGLPAACKWLLASAILLSLASALAATHGPQRAIRILLRSDGLMTIGRRDGQSSALTIHPHSTVTAWLSVILFAEGKRLRLRALVLLPDALNADDYRRLRLWLRWQAANAASRTGSAANSAP